MQLALKMGCTSRTKSTFAGTCADNDPPNKKTEQIAPRMFRRIML